jgi:hypothetical protein
MVAAILVLLLLVVVDLAATLLAVVVVVVVVVVLLLLLLAVVMAIVVVHLRLRWRWGVRTTHLMRCYYYYYYVLTMCLPCLHAVSNSCRIHAHDVPHTNTHTPYANALTHSTKITHSPHTTAPYYCTLLLHPTTALPLQVAYTALLFRRGLQHETAARCMTWVWWGGDDGQDYGSTYDGDAAEDPGNMQYSAAAAAAAPAAADGSGSSTGNIFNGNAFNGNIFARAAPALVRRSVFTPPRVHPATFVAVSVHGMRQLLRSQFLFARKFVAGAQLLHHSTSTADAGTAGTAGTANGDAAGRSRMAGPAGGSAGARPSNFTSLVLEELRHMTWA